MPCIVTGREKYHASTEIYCTIIRVLKRARARVCVCVSLCVCFDSSLFSRTYSHATPHHPQIKVTRQFPFALFCIRSASTRLVYASVVVHGYVRELIASYVGIDITSRIDRLLEECVTVENKLETSK